MIASRSGTLKSFTVDISAALGSGKSATFAIYDGVTSTGLTVSFGASGTTESDNTDTYSIAAGDLISMECSGTLPGGIQATWVFEIQ